MFGAMSERVRRLIGLFLALTLAIAGAAQSAQASDMAVKMSAASTSDMPLPSGCNGCSGDDDGMPMACSAVCGSTVAAIMPAGPTVASAVSASPLTPFITSVVDHHGPPDPYPPRPTSLS